MNGPHMLGRGHPLFRQLHTQAARALVMYSEIFRPYYSKHEQTLA